MLCEKALPLLSEYFDEVLDPDTAIQVSQHLGQCINCRRELDSFSALHCKLKSLDRIEAPECLHGLVQHRIASANQNTWKENLRDGLELRWSRIRTLEAMWYVTRALGTVMAAVFFVLITSAITPYYLDVKAPVHSISFTPDYTEQVSVSVRRKLGVLAAQKPVTRSNAAINDLYFSEFGDRLASTGKDVSFSFATEVDRSGSAKIQNVLEYPADKDLLNDFNEIISTARYRPASENGQAIRSTIVLIFRKISVYN